MTRTRILIVAQSPILPTGFGETTRLIFGALLDSYPGVYDLHQLALTHSFSVAEPRWPVYPTDYVRGEDGQLKAFDTSDLRGEKTFPKLVEQINPDIVFGFNDPHRLVHLCEPAIKRDYKLILHTTIDGLPFPPSDGRALGNVDLVVTMSAFSRDVLVRSIRRLDPEKVLHLYSPADTRRFEPVSSDQKHGLRRAIFPSWMPTDALVLGWIGRSQWRKQNWVAYEVIHHLRKGGYLVCNACGRVTVTRRTDVGAGFGIAPPQCRHCRRNDVAIASPLPKAYLWVHTVSDGSDCWTRSDLEDRFDLRPGRDIHYTDGHKVGAWKLPDEMPALYQSWDALIYLSGGEGFGLPAWEAMCSALPVIYTNYSSHAEFLNAARAGLPVGGILQPEPRTGIWRMIADVEQTIEAARKLYFDPDMAAELGQNGRTFVKQFTPSVQAHSWHKLFQDARHGSKTQVSNYQSLRA